MGGRAARTGTGTTGDGPGLLKRDRPRLPRPDDGGGDPVRILTLGGGSGQFALLAGLRDLPGIEITAVVSMVDSGGSTGRLRDEFGILPPGDILKCIVALSPHREMARTLLLKRFVEDRRLKGHNAGNMLLTMLSRYAGSFASGVQALAEILDVRGRILPVTVDPATLVAELTDGSRVFGEKAIDVPRGMQREKIREVFLVPHHNEAVSVYPPVIDAAWWADYILIGPGDLFTSILAALIVPGVAEALRRSRGRILYILNLMTKFGETDRFRARDFVERLEAALGRTVDGVIANRRRPPEAVLRAYRKQKADFVELDPGEAFWKDRRLYAGDLLDTAGGIVRHDSAKLAALIGGIIAADRNAPAPPPTGPDAGRRTRCASARRPSRRTAK
ncbi:MAG: uridine diphosphate-N-acetylglucosamine-binding protein YvcK [Desulfobacterales bacterium]